MLFVYVFVANFHVVFPIAGRRGRGARGAEKEVIPPLLAKVQGNLEVQCQIHHLQLGG